MAAVNQETLQLADRLSRLELHAARSGREVLRVLVNNLAASQQSTVAGLMQAQYEDIRCLLNALPPYAPPLNSINRVLRLLEDAAGSGKSVPETKRQLQGLLEQSEDPQISWQTIAPLLAKELPQEAVVYTHTLSETVLGVLIELHHLGRLARVNVTESRPNNDGWDTARRLAEQEVDVHLYIDAAMPAAIEGAHLMLSGAEIINQDGSVVGKVGAYPAAVLCQLFAKPVYIVAGSNKINQLQWCGFHLTSLNATQLGLAASLPSLHIDGSLFDITPARLIRRYATELGILAAEDLPALIPPNALSRWLAAELNDSVRDNLNP